MKASVAAGGALSDIGDGRASVWLYANDAGELVGYGSLGTIKSWRWPDARKSDKINAHHIPMLGIARRFRGKPDGPPDERYSSQIIDDLIEECRQNPDPDISSVVTLFVHPDNHGAIRLYERHGFAMYPQYYNDAATNTRYLGMICRL